MARVPLIWLALCLCMVTSIAGCGSAPTRPTTIPEPQGHGVTRLSALDSILNRPGLDIGALGTYTIPSGDHLGQSSARIWIVAEIDYNHGGPYMDVGIDGSDPHPLDLRISCLGSFAITQDGRWGACSTAQGIATFRLLPMRSAGKSLEEHLIMPPDEIYGADGFAWDPTGRYLAIARLNSPDRPTSALDIYALSATYDQARLVVRFSGAAQLEDAQWSPDGSWLTILATSSGSGPARSPSPAGMWEGPACWSSGRRCLAAAPSRSVV